jgi:hypothetical protein
MIWYIIKTFLSIIIEKKILLSFFIAQKNIKLNREKQKILYKISLFHKFVTLILLTQELVSFKLDSLRMPVRNASKYH